MADPIDRKAFDFMTTAVDKTAVDLFPTKVERSTEGIHNALMVAGMTPAYGNIADLADATLYALEGEFGEAGWSAAAAIPVIGQMVSGKRALKIAKESGEEMVTLWRGVTNADKYKMIKYGKYISPKDLFGKDPMKEALKYGIDPSYSAKHIKKMGRTPGGQPTKVGIWATKNKEDVIQYGGKLNKEGDRLLEFEVPKSWYDKNIHPKERNWFIGGIPEGFLKKVHK